MMGSKEQFSENAEIFILWNLLNKMYKDKLLSHQHEHTTEKVWSLWTREGPWGIDPRKSPGFPRPHGDGAGTRIGLQNLRGRGGDGEH